jgi:hypothetical protein
MAEYVETRRSVDVRRQRDEYGGTNWGAAFFGWLVAVGIGALLTAFVSAAGAAVAISEIENATEAVANADTIGIVGVLALLAIALIAYFAGGYVAGRMSRFDGARQGVGVWAWGIVVAIVLALLGAIAGSEYNLFADLDLPRVPVDEGEVTTGGVILLAVALIGTLLAAMAGGKAGERYHRRVDSVGAGRAELRDRDRDGDVDAEDRVYEDRPRRPFRDRVTS